MGMGLAWPGSHWAFRASALLRAEFSFLSAQSVRNRWRVRFVCLSEIRKFENSVASCWLRVAAIGKRGKLCAPLQSFSSNFLFFLPHRYGALRVLSALLCQEFRLKTHCEWKRLLLCLRIYILLGKAHKIQNFAN
ncbi:hypothetical protein M5D96_004767 [Drosophila gunungcola]|uniref:Uncharacterized protein n=1 Tax=Drosophila gunungcola TaxID=103775 RepID=A0A9P9YUL3_9MUSC|nr:hypothetical protein M5D96_004767 [Drosophila gunungcola]